MPESHALTRRTVLKGAAGAGAAGIAASALAGIAVPAVAAAATKSPDRVTNAPADEKADEAIVVHVRDAASGELDVFRGTSQVRLRDRALAAQIVRASR